MDLAPCTGCSRHVDVLVIACPFCGAREARRAIRRTPARISRAVIVGLVVAGASGCYESHRRVAHETDDAGVPVVADAGRDAGRDGGHDAGYDAGDASFTIYGGPPLDVLV